MKRFVKWLKGTYLALILLFLYSPIAVMIALSFNAGKSRAKWEGFSFKWYVELFTNNPDILQALRLTVEVAVIATVISVILGTLGAIGIHACKKGYASALLNLSYLPMTMPDIVTGVSLMLMFVAVNMPRGIVTMIMAHVTFDTPYVLFSVLPKLKQMNPNTYEAALDLGCKPMKAITKVILPARHRDRRASVAHHVAGRLRDFVLHVGHRHEPVDENLFRREAGREADDLRAVHADVSDDIDPSDHYQ